MTASENDNPVPGARREAGGSQPSADARPVPIPLTNALLFGPLGVAMKAKDELPELFEAVEQLREKARSQIRTANMIGKFVTPVLKRKVRMAVENQLAAVGTPARRPGERTAPANRSTVSADPKTRSPGQATAEPSKAPGKKAADAAKTRKAADAAKSVKAADAAKSVKTKTTAVGMKATATKPSAVASQAKPKATSQTKPKAKPGTTTAKATPTKPDSKPRTATKATAAEAGATVRRVPDGSSPERVDLGIEGYDGLPSSSIVPLLDALGSEQLAAVEAHERANRARRTVLHRANQLLGQ